MYTSQLFSTNLLDNIKVEAIIDSDTKKWGRGFFGFSIQPHSVLRNLGGTVLISSYDSQEETSKFLSKNYPNIKQIKLYDKVVGYNKGIKE